MKIITSRANPAIKQICSLHTKKGRSTSKQFIAEGLRTIKTLLTGTSNLIQLYVTQNHPIDLVCNPELVTFITPEVMAKISTTKTPSGYLALFTIPQEPQQKIEHGIVLANITDPGNMGTLMRSAAAMNIKAVIIVDGADPWSPKVVQASAGTVGSLAIYQCSWQELLELKKEKTLCALIVKGGKDPQELALDNILLVIGNEAHGIPEAWLRDCEAKCTLPMPGGIESLNAAIAGSIALYLMAT